MIFPKKKMEYIREGFLFKHKIEHTMPQALVDI